MAALMLVCCWNVNE